MVLVISLLYITVKEGIYELWACISGEIVEILCSKQGEATMKAGDAVWVRRDRDLTSSWQIRKILAVNPLGEPTHTGPWNSSLEEKFNDKNTLEYQQIGAFEEIPQEEQKGLTVFSSNPEVTDRLYTEQEKREINKLLAILDDLKRSGILDSLARSL